MSGFLETNVEAENSADIAAIETAIAASTEAEKKSGRAALLSWLRRRVEDAESELSVSELIAKASSATGPKSPIASVLLRSADGGLLHDIQPTGESARALIYLTETGLPELYDYLRIDQKLQTHLKFQEVLGSHQIVTGLLAPLAASYPDLESLLRHRGPILGSLNHTIVRAYCAVFDIKQVKASAENVFSKLKAVAAIGPTLLDDVEASKKAISDAHQIISESDSFLTRYYFLPLLSSASGVLEGFLAASRSRFTTVIKARERGQLQRRYPLHEPEREVQITIPFVNIGPGLATSLKVESSVNSEKVMLYNEVIYLGNVPPGNFSILLDMIVIELCENLTITLMLEWGEIGESTTLSDVFEFDLLAQANDVDWQSKEYWHPYSTEPAEGENFIGRNEKLRSLAAKIIRSPMESFYITGQKRVGKTSLALACVEEAKRLSRGLVDVVDSYNLWGSFAHEDPRASLQALGQNIEALLKDAIPLLRQNILKDLSGSLAPLIGLCDSAYRVAKDKRFVIIIDEFDDIHQELYLKGNLAETFFANLRALSRCKNMCVVLIGGENMPFVMERQGQKLNNFSRVSLSYYDRAKEWPDFRSMITAPTLGVVSWHEDAVGEVFAISNGNPYFAKTICSAVLEAAIRQRDTDVSAAEVQLASASSVPFLGLNSFAHLWQDGIPREMSEREPEIVLRTRVLVALARCYRKGLPPTNSNIFDSRATIDLSEHETSAVLNDFVRREVLGESGGLFTFSLPIFETWLVDVGASQLAANSLTAELASEAIREEMQAMVRSDEVAKLLHTWTTYRGRHFGSDEVRNWLQQVQSAKDQRLLFEILKRVRIFSAARVREMLEQSFSFLQPLPEFVIRKRSDRRKNVLVSYVDGEGKSGQNYASVFAEANLISSDCIISPGDFEKKVGRHFSTGGTVDSLVIIDDFVGTGRSLVANLEKFIGRAVAALPEGVPIRVITLLATQEGQRYVLDSLQRMSYTNIDFKPCEMTTESDFAFPESRTGWSSIDDHDRAKALCIDIGRRIYKQNPLGYGGAGLLVAFPTNVPNNSLPILHSPGRIGERPWMPLFERVTH